MQEGLTSMLERPKYGVITVSEVRTEPTSGPIVLGVLRIIPFEAQSLCSELSKWEKHSTGWSEERTKFGIRQVMGCGDGMLGCDDCRGIDEYFVLVADHYLVYTVNLLGGFQSVINFPDDVEQFVLPTGFYESIVTPTRQVGREGLEQSVCGWPSGRVDCRNSIAGTDICPSGPPNAASL